MTNPSWDPAQYLRYGDERSRPFFELADRLTAGPATTVADLGCGPGNLTATLLDRWPEATVLGVDSSPSMLAKAADRAVPGRLAFVAGDIASWAPEAPLDCIISNAALQWVPGHEALMPHLVSLLAPGGRLGFQVPFNRDQPAYRIYNELRETEPWAAMAPSLANDVYFVQSPEWYIATLSALGCSVDVWATTYYHQLGAAKDVVEWLKGTTLRPMLDTLPPEAGAEFEAEYLRRVTAAYPAGPTGVTFAFPRLFVVAERRP